MKPFSSFGLRQKILLGIAGAVLASLLTTLLAVNHWITASADLKVAGEFRRAERAFEEVRRMRASLLIWEGLAYTNSPRLFAAVETENRAAVEGVLVSEIPEVSRRDLYLVVNGEGGLLAAGGAARDAAATPGLRALIDGALGGESGSGAVMLGGEIYEAAASPILAGERVVGALVVGNQVSPALVDNLRLITGSEVALRVDEQIRLTTLPSGKRSSLEACLRDGTVHPVAKAPPPPADSDAASGQSPDHLDLAGERHLCSSIPLLAADGRPIGDFLLFQSVDHAIGSLDQLRRYLFGIAGLTGLLALFLAVFITRGITANVGQLVHGVREVERGNYDIPIVSRSQDEVGYLAGVFEEMRGSLKSRMTEAQKLTGDLRSQNVVLEETLRKLEATQNELVKSEKLALTSRLAAQLSHELNNPIYNIQTCMEILQKRIPPGDQTREWIDLVYEEVLRMSKLSKQMLSFAKPARDEMAPIDINRVLEDLLRVSTRWLEEKEIAVETRLAAGLPRVLASADQLRQVFLNLIVNASDAMPGGGRLRLETGANDGRVFIVVEDSGHGVPSENIEKIFDAFFTTKSEMSGVGLGLSISYGIVERHKGKIEVGDARDGGARFTVWIPALEVGARG